jgi:drug/metabolite transporter (DMT)-like permease
VHAVLGQLFALLTAVCWAQNSIVFGMAGRRVGAPAVAHVRLWIAMPAVLLVHLVFTGRVLPLHLAPSVYLYLVLSGLMGFFIADLCIFRAFVVLGHRETMVVMTLSPIFAAVLSWVFLYEALGVLQIAGILVTVAGVACVVSARSGPRRKSAHVRSAGAAGTAVGVGLATAGALAQAVGLALAKAVLTDDVHPVSANVVRISAGLFGLVVFALARREFRADFAKMRDRTSLLLTGSGAIVGPVMGIIFTLYGLRLAPVGVVTTIMQITPVILLPVDRFVFRMSVSGTAVIGTVLAVAGAAMLFV